jgi:hypothetical protein
LLMSSVNFLDGDLLWCGLNTSLGLISNRSNGNTLRLCLNALGSGLVCGDYELGLWFGFKALGISHYNILDCQVLWLDEYTVLGGCVNGLDHNKFRFSGHTCSLNGR